MNESFAITVLKWAGRTVETSHHDPPVEVTYTARRAHALISQTRTGNLALYISAIIGSFQI